ncbi:hypothetical protein KEM55_008025 [Ascosphaera atra]|nr:hypothetical protein KEM55_008025 [Ascosphaera atra]
MGNSTVTHMLLIKVKEQQARHGETEKLLQSVHSLKDRCLHPQTQQPYMLSLRGGRNDLLDDKAAGETEIDFTHGFVMEFANKTDRDYYLAGDAVHQQVKKELLGSGIVEKVRVVDFEN